MWCAFKPCTLEITVMTDWSESILPLCSLKTYLHYHNAYGHQTWQGGDLLQEVPTHKVADHVFIQNHMTS